MLWSSVSTFFERELDAVTDNPLVFPEDDDVLSGGNFHGQPLALALDVLAIALAQVASFSERRIFNLMGPHDWDESGVPLFLTPNPGLNSGFMITQYVAAALVNEIKYWPILPALTLSPPPLAWRILIVWALPALIKSYASWNRHNKSLLLN